MKKIVMGIVVFLMFALPVYAVEFGGKSVFNATFEHGILFITGKNINIKVSEDGTVKKFVPAKWETISGEIFTSTASTFAFMTGSGTWTINSYKEPDEYWIEIKEVGPYTIEYSQQNKLILVSKGRTIDAFKNKVTPFVLRVHTCGKVERLEWKEINKNEE
jgi:hypothetical protein